MLSPDSIADNYNDNAAIYDQFVNLPLGALEQQLFDLCIPDCSNLTVLDLGGGTGQRARDAIQKGAQHVDLIDISPEMICQGQAIEQRLNRDLISWYQGDISSSLLHLDHKIKPGSYDLVIANGIFDHAQNETEMDMMWFNAARYLKSGGMIIANRNDPFSSAAKEGKYGVQFSDFRRFEGGVKYQYGMKTNPPSRFESIGLDCYCMGDMSVPERYFEKFENVNWRNTRTVSQNAAFWEDYLKSPILYIFTARRSLA